MIKSNKRRPGTIKVPLQKQTNQNPNQNPTDYIRYHLNAQTHILQELSQQKTIKRSLKHKNMQFFALELSNMHFSNLERQLDQDIKLEYVKTLDLSRNQLIAFPSSIFNKLINLTAIDLQENALQKLSFPYFQPNLITTANLSNNHLSSLNLQHLTSLKELECQRNQLTFLTLPPILTKLDCSVNKLSNVYCIQHCVLLEQLYFSENVLYDLNLNFGTRTNSPNFGQNRFKKLQILDFSKNKIQHLEGLGNIASTRTLNLSGNKLAFTRNIINQLLLIRNLQQISFEGNPLTEAGFSQQEVYRILCSKMEALKIINGQQLCGKGHQAGESARKTQMGLNDEPYCLFMQTSNKKQEKECGKEWIFTLGDCEPNEPNEIINDLSQIEETEQIDETVIDRLSIKNQSRSLEKQHTDQQNDRLRQLLAREQQDLKLKIVRSKPSIVPSHVHYQPFLTALLQMSYVPCEPILHKASKITSKRLDEEHDDFVLIAKMFQLRGGVVYVKKITAWVIQDEGNDLFCRHRSGENTAQMGFLLNQVNQKQFRELCRYSKLVGRSENDIIGLQPNVFSCYHILVRDGYQKSGTEYLAAYLIESGHL